MQQSGQTRKQKPQPLHLDASFFVTYFTPLLFKSEDVLRCLAGQKYTQSWHPLHLSLFIETLNELIISLTKFLL